MADREEMSRELVLLVQFDYIHLNILKYKDPTIWRLDMNNWFIDTDDLFLEVKSCTEPATLFS